ncbi:serine/threonine protein kinase [Streptomyces venezuelae]|uniref:non-specific serine/threonine protein kinase n=1 Tax=Streptomyces venezuelae TaxID=54571 RepID=A0A5P2DTT9_STRVZ|nr:serine/threonine-protein kinase [Streptomyces venezuelae]QES57558.1 serine/threonine protein kinase [Streptomyces venezuelae]
MGTEGANARVIAGRYRLDAKLGRGGMGIVWRATDQLLGRNVAVKEVALDPALSEEEARQQRERTLREARAAAQLKHPHIIVVHDIVEDGELPYIVMELVEGGSLADRLSRTGPVDVAEAARIGAALVGALRTAHAAGVLHRDIKPANVLLEAPGGRPVLTDFGIAQVSGATTLTTTGSFVGSPEYTAPERMSGRTPAGPEADLWSLGALLCAALSGASPFRRDSLGGILHAVVFDEIRPPEACGPLLPVVRGLLERDPAERIGAERAERMLRDCAQSAGQYTPTRYTPALHDPAQSAPAPQDASPQPPGGPQATAVPQTPDVPRTPDVPLIPSVPQTPAAHGPARAGAVPASAPTPLSAPVPAPGPPHAPGRRRPAAALIAGLLLAAITGAGVSAALLTSDGGRGGRTSTSGAAGQASTPASSAATGERTDTVSPSSDDRPAPAGYRVVTDPEGFSLAVPLGFTRKVEGPRIFYMSPGETFRIGIKVAEPESGGPLAVHQRAHAKGPGTNPGYRDAEVATTAQNGLQAALWLFTWDGFSPAEGPRHTRDLCWEEDGRLYDVWVSSPVRQAEEARGYFDTAVRTFVRTGD